jgi:hypothetical protein
VSRQRTREATVIDRRIDRFELITAKDEARRFAPFQADFGVGRVQGPKCIEETITHSQPQSATTKRYWPMTWRQQFFRNCYYREANDLKVPKRSAEPGKNGGVRSMLKF